MKIRATDFKFSVHACCMLLAFSQPDIKTLNCLVAASKLYYNRVTGCIAEWPFYLFAILCTVLYIMLIL